MLFFTIKPIPEKYGSWKIRSVGLLDRGRTMKNREVYEINRRTKSGLPPIVTGRAQVFIVGLAISNCSSSYDRPTF